MPSLKPFKGVIYDTNKIEDLSLVVAPPYDIISKKLQNDLYSRDAHNVVRLILGKIRPSDTARNNRYTRSRDFFKSLLEKGVMTRDVKPAIYIYSQGYRFEGRRIEMMGFISLMKLEMGKNAVHPHENTLHAPKVDRLNLIREVKANLSPIFILYDDNSHSIMRIMKSFTARNRPFIDMDVDGVKHRVWKLDDSSLIKKMDKVIRSRETFIADGHHRYQVSLNYASEVASSKASPELAKNSKYAMAYFVEFNEKILTILPTHRVIKDVGGMSASDMLRLLEGSFIIRKASSLEGAMKKLASLRNTHAFAAYLGGNYYALQLKDARSSDRVMAGKPKEWRRLDVSILHKFLLEHLLGIRDQEDNIEFVKDPKDGVKLVKTGSFKAAFFLNPTKALQMKKIAQIGERMPRKATYFYPKPLTGLVVNKLD
ncbi:MAG: DUF1015 domain-containing protein [Candidatus Omnitrophota bacterium]|jgi:uncharacterized protein (DUF1015 family)